MASSTFSDLDLDEFEDEPLKIEKANSPSDTHLDRKRLYNQKDHSEDVSKPSIAVQHDLLVEYLFKLQFQL